MGLFENPAIFHDDPVPSVPEAEPEIPLAEAVLDAPRRSWLFPGLFAAMGWSVAAIIYLSMAGSSPAPEPLGMVDLPIVVGNPPDAPGKPKEMAADAVAIVLPMPRVMPKAAIEETTEKLAPAVANGGPPVIKIKPEHYRANKNGHQCAWNSIDTAAMTVGRSDPGFSKQTEGFAYIGPVEEMADHLARTATNRGLDVGMIRNKAALDKTVNIRRWPVIVGLKTSPKDGHALLVVGTDTKNVYVVDNMNRELAVEKIGVDEFAERWTGSALAVLPPDYADRNTQPFNPREYDKWEEHLKTATVREIGPEEARNLSLTRGGSVDAFRVIYAHRPGVKPAHVVFDGGKAYMIESDHYPPVCVPTRSQLLRKMSKSPGEDY